MKLNTPRTEKDKLITEAFKLIREQKQGINIIHARKLLQSSNETAKRLGDENRILKDKNSQMELELEVLRSENDQLKTQNENLIENINI